VLSETKLTLHFFYSVALPYQGGLLTQTLPSFVCGLFTEKVKARSLMYGMAFGTLAMMVVVVWKMMGHDIIVDAGIWGTILNVTVVMISEMMCSSGGGGSGGNGRNMSISQLNAPIAMSGKDSSAPGSKCSVA
jgi:Na+/proline symporter